MMNNNLENKVISDLLKFANPNPTLADMEAKYKANKAQLKEIIDSCSFKASNDKEFFKLIFKLMDNYLNKIDDIVFNKIDVYIQSDFLSKIILFLKYKKGLNYREKIKMIKSLSEGVTANSLLACEKLIISHIEYFAKYDVAPEHGNMLASPHVIGRVKNEADRDILRTQLLLFKNTLEIIKCVVFNYHKKELMYVEDGTPKYKLVRFKTIYIFESEFKISTEVDMDDLMELLKLYEDDKNKLIYDVDSTVAGIILNACIKEDLRTDDYNKYLLDKSYNSLISNRLNSFLTTNSCRVNSFLFMTRKVLIPKNGVVILVENEESSIESIFLSEKLVGDTNNIYFITRYKNGTEIINSVLLNKKMAHNATIFMGLAEINDTYFNTLGYIFKFLNVNIAKDEIYNSIKFSVIAPYYWKYRHKNYKSENDIVDSKGVVIKREFEIEIAPFVRKIKGQPSSEALKLADKLGVVLEEHHTIVKPHKRVYNKIK